MAVQKSKGMLGVTLVVLGILFLAVNNHLLWFGWASIWPVFPFLGGIVVLRLYAAHRKPGELFVAAVLTQAGLFFFVFSTGLVPWPAMGALWPFLLLIPGIALLAVSGSGQRPVSALIVGLATVAVSMVGFWVATGGAGNRVLAPLFRFWPAALVVTGAMILFHAGRARRETRTEEPEWSIRSEGAVGGKPEAAK